jgi:PTH1 family peptidyl-tRNA hydrolase
VAHDGWVIVGIGNPGPSYADTRHNVGYLVTDELVDRMHGSWKAHKSGRALVAEGRLAGQPGVRAVIGRARSYMNESGGPVSTLLSYYKTPLDRLVVVQDEVDLPYGVLRIKFGGGDNGHNGLKSLRKSLGSGDYYRVRVGIGRPHGRTGTADHVLKAFTPIERRELDLHVQRAADAVESLLTDGLERTQNMYNR